MPQELIISVSGLRGVVGETLSPDVALQFATAFASTLSDGPILVTRDGRANGAELIPSIVAGLSQGGSRVVFDAGIAATPTTGVLVRQNGCSGGVQISASHNPAEYNGMKLFSGEGRVLPAAVGQQVLERFQNLTPLQPSSIQHPTSNIQHPTSSIQHPASSIGVEDDPAHKHTTSSVQHVTDTTSAHLELIEKIVDAAEIRSRRFRVLLDANHGSGSVLGRQLLERLGCDLVLLGSTPDGQFAHPPEPTSENLAGVLAEVVRAKADIGFCQDPDADRLAIIDEHGRYLGEEYTLALCVDHVLRRTLGPVITNCSTSRMTEDLAHKYGVSFFRSAVGEANVVDEMLLRGAVLGGEGNGGVIDPRVGLVRDSFVGMALVLHAMAARGKPASELADELPRYAIWKSKIELPKDAVAMALESLEKHFSDATSDRLDGLRLDWQYDDGRGSWLLVRASNTEPIVRIIAEAPTDSEARRLCDDAAATIRSIDPSSHLRA
jgi:phosphomannomutase